MKPFLKDNIDSKSELLKATDPVEEPTKIARSQGFIQGVKVALDYVENRIERKKKQQS
jgi:hypothetical protein